MNDRVTDHHRGPDGEFQPSLPNFNNGPPAVLRRSQQLLTACYNREARKMGLDLTEPQLDVLRAISLCKEPPDQTALALMLGYDRSTTSSIIDGLVRRKLVRRAAGTDRRRRTLALTEKAASAMTGGSQCAERSGQYLFQALTQDEIMSLLEVLEMVAMKSATPAPPLRIPSDVAGLPGNKVPAAALYRAPHFLMRRCMQIVAAYVSQQVAPFGLSSGLQFIVLYIVSACQPVSQKRIGEALWIDKSSVSLVLSLLQSAGMIERSPDPQDQRRLLSTVTPTGLKMLEKAVSMGEQIDHKMFEDLPAGTRGRFTAMLAQIVDSKGGFEAPPKRYHSIYDSPKGAPISN